MSESERNDSKIQKLLRDIREKSPQGEYIYRGELQKYKKISSALYRKYEANIEAEEFSLQIAQGEMLKQVKEYTDFTDETDVLTELQHYGGKTNLIDFTTDYLIALFFACDGLPEENGRVILLNRKSNKERIASPKKNLNNRVISQKSIFFQSPKGYLDEEDFAVIPIPGEMKQPVLQYLSTYHGITTHTIYNDIFGYIQNQEKHQNAYTKFYIGLTCQEKGEYEEAIKHYDETIHINRQHAEAYNNRGAAKAMLGRYEEAIADYDQAIRINRQDAAAYNNRVADKGKLGRHEEAMADYTETIRINSKIAAAYNNRGADKDKLGRHEEAIEDYNEAIRINPQYAEAYNHRGIANIKIKAYKKARVDLQHAFELSTRQGDQEWAQNAQRLLDELPPSGSED